MTSSISYSLTWEKVFIEKTLGSISNNRNHRFIHHPKEACIQWRRASLHTIVLLYRAGKKATWSVRRLREFLGTKHLVVSRSCQEKSSCLELEEFVLCGRWVVTLPATEEKTINRLERMLPELLRKGSIHWS